MRRGHLERMRLAGKPVVLVSHSVPGFPAPAVVPDNLGGVRAALEHLFGHGHRKIAFVGNLYQRDMAERYDAYRQTLLDHGIEPDPALFFEAVDNIESGGRDAARRMVAGGLPSTAVIAATDQNAIGLLQGFTEAGVRVPDEQAIVGFDDSDLVRRVRPPLASVSQQIEGLGELTGRLILAQIAGQEVAAGDHRHPALFVARDSCGCTRTALAAGHAAGGDGDRDGTVVGSARRAGRADAAGELRARLVVALREILLGDPGIAGDLAEAIARQADVLADEYEAVLDQRRSVDLPRVHAVAESLWGLNLRRREVSDIVPALDAYVDGLLAGPDPPDRQAERSLHAALLQTAMALAGAHVLYQRLHIGSLEDALGAQYQIDMDLLRHGEDDPRNLTWVPGSQLTAACLALWRGHAGPDGDRSLRIVGAHDPAGALNELVGGATTVRQFPPPELIERADPGQAEIVYATQVRVGPSDWGMLATLGPVQARGGVGRDRFNHWAALLAVALNQEELLSSLRRQRADLAHSYERERELVETVRASEERYALAACAANDGLWDWNVSDATIYYSSRWKAMLGCTEEQVGDGPEEWFSRVHPDDRIRLDAAIAGLLDGTVATVEHQHRLRTAAGGYRWMLCRALAVRDVTGRATRIVGSLTDVTERTELEEQLRQRALYDQVTGLHNRSYFHDVLAAAIGRARRNPEHHFAVLFLDLDGFKVINDSLGHTIGDLLLVGVAERLRACLRAADTAARFGGDEFAILLDDARGEDVPEIVSRLQETLRLPFQIDDHEVVVSASIGVALSTTGYDSAVEVLRDADIAMYRSKARERGTHTVFNVTMRAGALERMRTEVELRTALEAGQFELHYQPIVRLDTGKAVGLEALLRWVHPDRGLVYPMEFLPIAEETGLIVPIGHWVIEQACRDITGWRRDLGIDCSRAGLRVSVNVSNRQFWHGALLSHLTEALGAAKVRPSCFAVEITEGVIMHNPEHALRTLQQLREYGVALQIDDFGTGYSSLGSLRRYPIQGVKIDRSFIAALGNDDKDAELVNTILIMGKNLGVEVIAEGVEDGHQADLLEGMGCALVQGYYYAKPVPGARVPELLAGPLTAPADCVPDSPDGRAPARRVAASHRVALSRTERSR